MNLWQHTEQVNNMDNDFSEKYIAFLLHNLPAAKPAAGRSEVVCKCKYCADSRDPRHGHMYISIPSTESDPSFHYCQKCHTGGIVDSRKLIEWGIYDPEIASVLGTINKAAAAMGKTVGYDRVVYDFMNYAYDRESAQLKAKYINDRLSLNLTIDEMLQEKVVFNLGEALYTNRINTYTRHANIIKQISDNFVGFLSFDNNFVNFRKCTNNPVYQSIDKRYINYNIHDKKDNTEKFYVMPGMHDLSIPTRIPVHVAEGPFDILSIKYNLRKKANGIYAAISGSAYKGLLIHLINTLKMYYIEVHVYPDNDEHGDDHVMNDIKTFLKPYMIPMYVHRNIYPGQKDFGVSLDKIKEVII